MTQTEAKVILELPDTFTLAELKRAYRDSLFVWHPDRFAGNRSLEARATVKTQSITNAYTLLRDELEKKNSATSEIEHSKNQTQKESTPSGESPIENFPQKGIFDGNSFREFMERNPGRTTGTVGMISTLLIGVLFTLMEDGVIKELLIIGFILGFIVMIVGLFMTFWDKDKC